MEQKRGIVGELKVNWYLRPPLAPVRKGSVDIFSRLLGGQRGRMVPEAIRNTPREENNQVTLLRGVGGWSQSEAATGASGGQRLLVYGRTTDDDLTARTKPRQHEDHLQTATLTDCKTRVPIRTPRRPCACLPKTSASPGPPRGRGQPNVTWTLYRVVRGGQEEASGRER
ncbi:hypothetical protein Q5P01_005743 [Channa striata]|uniref:Uncharacterized protein n=1 Tax=Channa striata TaxID=64152 RepID=A0AA88ND44_CHASR|nr:hypothetical protein Q5P01_005743 [Channa striata]